MPREASEEGIVLRELGEGRSEGLVGRLLWICGVVKGGLVRVSSPKDIPQGLAKGYAAYGVDRPGGFVPCDHTRLLAPGVRYSCPPYPSVASHT